MRNHIAIVGLACRYPDAASPSELWTNILARRKAFRAFPPERLSTSDYWSADPSAVDCTYVREGAFLANYHFDRLKYRISGEAFRSSDMTHWLALDVAALALEDAGFPSAEGIPKESTAVYLGNTLTGEFSRSSIVRQRWPYVRRVIGSVLNGRWSKDDIAQFLCELEPAYKAPFPEPGAESLVGGLANTIAGRICNYFDLKGGGYIVDGACASSLLAVSHACAALTSGDVDVAIAGGVDLSMDPFELVGFARVGALAKNAMRVYDRKPTGFIPGEGCGMLVLMRQEDANRARRRIYGVIRGWGISSDGAGGMTRPEIAGQMLAIERAYQRAELTAADVHYIEGHGTGTEAGDAVELQAMCAFRSRHAAEPAAIGSIKANIGHTKAAAGIAGLIKASLAVSHRILPPTTGCEEPHELLSAATSPLYVLDRPMAYPSSNAMRAGVNAMGFGGINTHVIVESPVVSRRKQVSVPDYITPDVELFVFSAADLPKLQAQVNELATQAAALSLGEMSDAAVSLANKDPGDLRLAILAATPTELAARLTECAGLLERNKTIHIDTGRGIFLGFTRACRIGYAFPGQAAPVRHSAGSLAKYSENARALFERTNMPQGSPLETAVAQPSVVLSSLAGLAVLDELAIHADCAVAHSLGEISALCWAGAFPVDEAIVFAAARGRLMGASNIVGSMLSLSAPLAEVEALCQGTSVSIAAINTATRIVVSGSSEEIGTIASRARANHIAAIKLPVKLPFHSGLIANLAPLLVDLIPHSLPLRSDRKLFSSITGDALPCDVDVTGLLTQQVTGRVEFLATLQQAAAEVDCFIEVGPGAILSDLIHQSIEIPVVSLDCGSASHHGLLSVVALLFSFGIPFNLAALFAKRYAKPFVFGSKTSFLENPCERVPTLSVSTPAMVVQPPSPAAHLVESTHDSALETVRRIVSEVTELPMTAIGAEDRFFDHLRLSSIVVATIAAKAARALERAPLAMPTGFASGTIATLAEALNQSGPALADAATPLEGISNWTRCFVEEMVPASPRLPLRASHDESRWRLTVSNTHPLHDALVTAFDAPGEGVVLCLEPGEPPELAARTLLRLLQEAPRTGRLGVIHHGTAPVAFLRSIHAERPDVSLTVVHIPVEKQLCRAAYEEIYSSRGMHVVHYGEDGKRCTPQFRVLALEPGPFPLTCQDVLLAVGGAKGIGAEAALALCRKSHARVALLGRSDVSSREVATNLLRFAAAGVPFLYLRTDITDPVAVSSAMREAERTLGAITAVLHTAAVNTPRSFSVLTEADLDATVAPKKNGLANVMKVVSPAALRVCITFGSIIGITGMEGNADYALANESMRLYSLELAAQFPKCRFIHLDWSVWSGAGMAERLGSVERLAAAGISAISPEQGLAVLERILCARNAPQSLMIASRFTALPGISFPVSPPLLRFLEDIKTFVPGVELIAEAKLNTRTDPYLADHVLDATAILPAVFAMEAMTQAAHALAPEASSFTWRDLEFIQPISVPAEDSAVIRIYALREENGTVRVVIRSGDTAFGCDHFRGSIYFDATETPHPRIELPPAIPVPPHDPATELYGRILFQSGRFQCVLRYEQLSATTCRALLGPSKRPWFGAYLPATLLAGDPGIRDAALHCIQACIPHKTILPVMAAEVRSYAVLPQSDVVVHAAERSGGDRRFVYDIDLYSVDGALLEQWRGAVFAAVRSSASMPIHSELLAVPYLQRRALELAPGLDLRIAASSERKAGNSRALLAKVAGSSAAVLRRADGKPEVFSMAAAPAESAFVSASHAGEFLLVAGCSTPLACDLEIIEERHPEAWRLLLTAGELQHCQYLVSHYSVPFTEIATRMWCLKECLIKVGQPMVPLLRVLAHFDDGWLILGASPWRILTWAFSYRSRRYAIAIAIQAGVAIEPGTSQSTCLDTAVA